MLSRHHKTLVEAVRDKHGQRVDKVAAYLYQGDDLADKLLDVFAERRREGGQRSREDAQMFDRALDVGYAACPQAPKALCDLFRQVEDVPLWLDRNLLDIGARTYLRCGPMPALILGCCCLPLAYSSAVGNKPLAFTRKLVEMAGRRLNTTGGFFLHACTPGALMPHGAGWKKTVQVRIQHAQMRRLLRQTAWNVDELGQPINQLYLAGTGLLFSVMSLKYLRRLGFYFSAEESEGVMHLWRYAAYLMGIIPELLCATETEGRNLVEVVLDLNGVPDKDSLSLHKALMETALPELMETALPWLKARSRPDQRWLQRRLHDFAHRFARLLKLDNRAGRIRLCYGLSQGLLGQHTNGLNYQQTTWTFAAPVLLWSCIAPFEMVRRIVPGATDLAASVGLAWCRRILGGKDPTKSP